MKSSRAILRAVVRRAKSAILGQEEVPPLRSLTSDPRWPTFFHGLDYLNYEMVEGDIAEFGVFSGVSLMLLSHAQEIHEAKLPRRVVGFDSFAGLPVVHEEHPRWKAGSFATNLWSHPVLKVGEAVTPDAVRELARSCHLNEPELHVGLFDKTIPRVVPQTYSKIALAHIDCDVYESAVTVLEFIEPALQDGSMLLFDDWYLFKGNLEKGEARAFREFLEKHPHWGANHYRSYGTCCNSFILYRK